VHGSLPVSEDPSRAPLADEASGRVGSLFLPFKSVPPVWAKFTVTPLQIRIGPPDLGLISGGAHVVVWRSDLGSLCAPQGDFLFLFATHHSVV